MIRSTRRLSFIVFVFLQLLVSPVAADTATIEEAAEGLVLRGVGPAMMGGRIADIAIHPEHDALWYVAVGSGGVWKTSNAGTTWTPIFDQQGSYSIGDVTVDPANPQVVWVGTGENVSGRHVGWGDGVYRSADAGRTWSRMGLEKSEHIGKILVDPRDGNVVYVAAQGPLWAAGGERGLYKTNDGGKSWRRVLHIDDNTGITDIAFHPTDPDVIYAAAYERRRHVWGLMAGGPGSGIYKSTDGGESWLRKSEGLPDGDMGKIGLAVTPANPDLVYATIEADADSRGFYRSEDRGESWVRKNDYISGGTGPHYYQEIVASPQDENLVFQMDVFFNVTRDGGETFSVLGSGREKHSDNHALWIDPTDDRHMIAGSDAGLYESFDQGATWRHFPNLPVSQFYKVAVDNSEPFYNILAGAQDLGTLFGPSRTMITEGVRNQDWYVPLGADGYSVVFDPGDDNVSYMEYQQGYMFRHHRDSNELVHIQPQPAPGEPPERWNWDTPITISPHDSSRLYVGSQRVWRSDDRGNAWRPVSEDLTSGQNRYELGYSGRVWSVDALHDNGAMSKYATITSISESPVREGTIYVGTDDGMVHATRDGGETWQRAAPLPTAAEPAFINDIVASRFDADTVFAVADSHKLGDFAPYVFVSENRGRSWRAISGDLPNGTIAWAIQQDHENERLLFLGTEYGARFSLDGGKHWHEFAGAPTIAFRDITLQRRDDDFVGATFGRGIYILDDYSPLRGMAEGSFGDAATVFPRARRLVVHTVGAVAGRWHADVRQRQLPSAEPGVRRHRHLLPSGVIRIQQEQRRSEERTLREAGRDIPFPGWDRLTAESRESASRVLLLVRDAEGEPVRWLQGPSEKGTHRVAWDLRFAPPDAIDLSEPSFEPPWVSEPQGPLAAPGEYSVQLYSIVAGEIEALADPQYFAVKPVRAAADGTDYAEVAAFQQKAGELRKRIAHAGEELDRAGDLLKHMKAAALEAPDADPSLFTRLDEFGAALDELGARLYGDSVRQGLDEATRPSIAGRAYNAANNWNNTFPATATQETDYEIAREDFAAFNRELRTLLDERLQQLEADLLAAGAPSWR